MKIKFITKRDKSQVAFDIFKIKNAIFRANINSTDKKLENDELGRLCDEVVALLDENHAQVEQIQDKVEEVLIKNALINTAKSYILYRQKRTQIRNGSYDLLNLYDDLTFKDSKEADLKRENANINSDSAMGMMLKYGSEGAKYYVDECILPKHIANAHKNGDIHIHDKDFYMLTQTCCQIDLLKLFENGFSTGHGSLREPNDIRSYASLACIALQANQNEMHGGQSIPNFDFAMAKGVAKTFQKEYKKAINAFFEIKLEQNLDEQCFKNANFQVSSEKECFKELLKLDLNSDENFLKQANAYAYKRALKQTQDATFQAMEALVHNLNTMNSRAGAQVPFSTLNYGTDTSFEGQMVIENLLKATMKGLGNGETPIFPVQIFKVKEGINYNEKDPNYKLFKLAIECASKRLFPNFSFLDASFNAKYYKKGDYNSEVAYMGCRTRVMANVYDESKEITSGRGNLSFTSINLVRLAIEAKGNLELFYSLLKEKLELVYEQLLHRYKIQSLKKVKNFPFLMGEGIWIDSDSLKENDSVEKIIAHGTLAIGYIGLCESLIALVGSHHGQSQEARDLGLQIVRFMREFVDEKSLKDKLNFSLIATPAEGLSGRFLKLDQKKYGILKGITDKDFYTNSFHIPVDFPISIYEKIQIEAPYHELNNGGHITYVELNGDVSKNLESFERIVKCMKESNIGYGSINFPLDRDPVCGYSGVIDEFCPKCHRKEDDIKFERIRRITGYLVGTLDRFNDAKKAEVHARIKHDFS
ncbi:anaerobic ribonucleoside triphosphate reductase [Campylobacter sp. IFREMER_LSEM_CL1846]|uniref:anaerobic ribonucleoside triphosphate reductase n=1 Tax=Campylobacter sp. IFREMER_LSEM_CL1846 TaxID=2911614 RepID=UPI0021E63218|nr:anaerobic ribonucleoside triphosphate reductase [Campylobacter sp. IFREMER_LSEM_CL1846]HEC1747394.1 anaerobic ribonucleoside triphosphate reductase [Campylobacter lari]MCV3433759.1 anaerobic ribonucleoside triphosphate reductase [Campylobacter sp. IFREMER_LSEM_CL1846]HEC1767934.1 anaerobic ribonucleoside triphosphate reductase [Campylobacter lari]HEC1789898.1 anaerobic ribonucleoside triphosphate reductase [Campylobacter lari]HEC1795319.1 anaerobic ribonucleoside triphosphate reductase [Cam